METRRCKIFDRIVFPQIHCHILENLHITVEYNIKKECCHITQQHSFISYASLVRNFKCTSFTLAIDETSLDLQMTFQTAMLITKSIEL